MSKYPTLRSCLSDAELFRRNGWKRGTRLVGDEGYGPTVIEITAVGDGMILARRVSHNGATDRYPEGNWGLSGREWSEVSR